MRFLICVLLALAGQAAYAGPYDGLRATTLRLPRGSGSVVQAKSGKRFALTNWHVCVGSLVDKQIIVSYPDGRSMRGEVVATDPLGDLCLIRLPYQDIPALIPAESHNHRDQLYTRGYPEGVLSESEGVEKGHSPYSYTYSIEAIGECPRGARKRFDSSQRLYGCSVVYQNVLTTLYAQPGSSGSPVVNQNGRLAGVIQSYHPGEGAGLVPLEKVLALLARF